MEELIQYLQEEYKVEASDLVASEQDRVAKSAKLDLIAEIKEIYERGYPNGRNVTK